MRAKALLLRAAVVLAFGLLSRLTAAAEPDSMGQGVALETGTRVRVTLKDASLKPPEHERLVGLLSGIDPDALTLAVSSSEKRYLRRDAILRLERSVRPSRKGAGAIIGFGLGFGAAFLYMEHAWQWNCLAGGGCDAGVLFATIVVSTVAACPIVALGSLVAPGEQWAEVSLERARVASSGSRQGAFRLGVAPFLGRRSGLALVVSF